MATFQVVPGDTNSDQAVDGAETWFVHTAAPEVESGATRLLWATPLAGGLGPVDANLAVSVAVQTDVTGARAALGALGWAPPAFSPDAKHLALAAPLQLVSLSAAPAVTPLSATRACFALATAFSIDGQSLAAACADGVLRTWTVGGDPTTPALEVDLGANLPPPAALSATAMVNMGAGRWRLVVAGDQLAPRIIDIADTDVSVADLTQAGVRAAAGPGLAVDPVSRAQLLVVNQSTGAFTSRLVKAVPPYSVDAPLVPPSDAIGATHPQYSPEGAFVLATLFFASESAAPSTRWTQLVAWHLPDAKIAWQGARNATPLTGDGLTRSGRVYTWAPSPAPAGTVAVWRL